MKTIEQKAVESEYWKIFRGESFKRHLAEYLESALLSGALDIDHQPTAETARIIFHAALAAYTRPAGHAAEKIQTAMKNLFLFV